MWFQTQAQAWVRPGSVSGPVPVLVVNTADGLDLGGLAVRAPVLPVLVVSAVPLTLHDVLLAPVSRVLVAHKAAEEERKSFSTHSHWL